VSKGVVGRSPKMIQNVFVLLLLSLFAILSTFLVTVGAQLYRNTVDSAEKNNATRIVTTVVRSSIWAEDGGVGEIRIEKLPYEGKEYNVLTIIRKYGEEKDTTWARRIYTHNGYLQESYTEYYDHVDKSELGDREFEADPEDPDYVYAINSFNPEYGEPLCELEKFDPALEGKLLTVNLETADHLTSTVRMYMRTGGAGQ